MTGANSGDAEDLLGQFLAHRAAPASARSTPAPAHPTPDATPEPTEDLEEDAAERADEALEESVDGPVYELADAPLDFSAPEPPVTDTLAHAGAVLEAFATGTLDVAPEAELETAPDAAFDEAVYEVASDAEDLEVDPLASAPSVAAPTVTVPASPANDASRAVLAAFLGTTDSEPVPPPPPEPHPEPAPVPQPWPEPWPEPTPEPAPEPEPEPGPEPEPWPEPWMGGEPELGLPLEQESDTEPEAPVAAPDEAAAFEALAVSSPLARDLEPGVGHRAPVQAEEPDDRPDATAASAAVFAAFQEQLGQTPTPVRPPSPVRPPEPIPLREPESEPEVAPAPEAEVEAPIAAPTTRAQAPKPARHRPPRAEPKVTAPRLPAAPQEPEPERAGPAVPNEVVFKPRRMARALVALILIVFVAASATACWWAYRDRTLVPVGIAATVLIATGIVWATRAGSTVAHLSVRGGRLEITKDGTRTVFDLSSAYTEVTVQGTPGKRNWRVLFGRRGLPPYVVDATMVSPAEFMRVLNFYRPPEGGSSNR